MRCLSPGSLATCHLPICPVDTSCIPALCQHLPGTGGSVLTRQIESLLPRVYSASRERHTPVPLFLPVALGHGALGSGECLAHGSVLRGSENLLRASTLRPQPYTGPSHLGAHRDYTCSSERLSNLPEAPQLVHGQVGTPTQLARFQKLMVLTTNHGLQTTADPRREIQLLPQTEAKQAKGPRTEGPCVAEKL